MNRGRRWNQKNKIPEGWLGCPSMGTGFVDDRFFVFKTPLKSDLNSKVSVQNRFTLDNVLEGVQRMNNSRPRLGLWIDLTNTNRYYDASSITRRGIQYEKLSCEGHGKPPSRRDVRTFCSMVNHFFRRNQTDYVGVHCTHGFNRTGYLICCYLIQYRRYNAPQAVLEFARNREPGIYRQQYVDELFMMSYPVQRPFRVTEPEWLKYSHEPFNILPNDDTHGQSQTHHQTNSSGCSQSSAVNLTQLSSSSGANFMNSNEIETHSII